MAIIVAPRVGWRSYSNERGSELAAPQPVTPLANVNELISYAQGANDANSQTQGYSI